MRLNSDAYFENLAETELNQRLSSLGELNQDEDIENKKENLKKYERSRHFVVWHDAYVIDNHGHVMLCMILQYFKQDMMLMCKERLTLLNFT